MPRLRRLNGRDLVRLFQRFGFEVVRVRGSHHHMQRVVGGRTQNLNIPVHGKKPLQIGTLRSIYRQACRYIAEDELHDHFYTD